jgi:hypothetical protein
MPGRVAFERQMNILLPDARHFHLKDDAVIFLINVVVSMGRRNTQLRPTFIENKS